LLARAHSHCDISPTACLGIFHGGIPCDDRRPAGARLLARAFPVSDAMQLFLLLLAWVAIAVGFHASIRRYYLASFMAACAMVAALQLASYLQTGKLDPLWPLSSLIGFCLAVIIALATGLPFRVKRIVREHHDQHSDP
jgi:hypothetical protein